MGESFERPLAPGSVSLRLYPHLELASPEIVRELVVQAQLAMASGLDGIMLSEHHNGFAGYLPNPIQAAGWVLGSTPRGWAAPCPLLLPLRPPALVVEELAWLAARFPGRVAAGVAAGSLEADFGIMNTTKVDLTARFSTGLAQVSAMLSGRDLGALADDPAVAHCSEAPIPLVSAAVSSAAARRAAANGVGLLLDSLASVGRCRALVDAYEEAGGPGPVVLV
ncbi:MAG: LLM class flavin-dependent oxidoreductase, partial [Gemmatimonadales bacterium]